MREIRQKITDQQDEIVSDIRQLVEEQYCPVHGKFAEFQGIVGELGSEEGARIQFSTCCEDLRKTIEDALQARAQP